MKFQFKSDLDHQNEAIQSVVDLFEGQPITKSNFTVMDTRQQMTYLNTTQGVSNKLILDEDDLLENLRKVQLNNGLKQSKSLKRGDYHFTVEMETGTGKTYVYLKTILEMYQKYGFSKFVIVVPSIAIKEGVNKSLEITKEHFKKLYQNTPYDYFVYDSSKLEKIRSFATSDSIQIMVINIDAFRKSFDEPDKEKTANIIHRRNDRLNGMKPIHFISQTNPIVIIDEPQSVDTTTNSKKAIDSLNPLCTLRYSATHVDKHHMVYKLDSIDAYEKQLVKQIEVASITAEDSDNAAFIEFLSVDYKKKPIKAKLRIAKDQGGKIKKEIVMVKKGDDLYDLSGYRDVYEGYHITDIYAGEGAESVYFSSKDPITLGEVVGRGLSDDEIKRAQIQKSIESHLDKEMILNKKGIKVLSLFFIDKVANYRSYDEDGNEVKGKYAKWFEEEYKKIRNYPKYNDLLGKVDIERDAELVHDGYFSEDKKGRVKDSKIAKDGTLRATKDDESTFNKIMKNKEKLLSFKEPLKFIFSHSALKEGWDNPNVFQICTLNETRSEVKKRQEIGRGLRLCVNQEGERIHGFDTNTLTVMANQSYEDFVIGLQNEIEKEEGIRFGVVEDHYFANIKVKKDQEEKPLGQEESEKIWKSLLAEGYINSNGKVQEKLKRDLKDNSVKLPEEYQELVEPVTAKLKKIAGNLNIKNEADKKTVQLNKRVYLSEEFKALWDKIKYKTTYSVEFDEDKLIQECVKSIVENLKVGRAKLQYLKALVDIHEAGATVRETNRETIIIDKPDYQLPDLITYLQNKTNLTRRTIVDILRASHSLELFVKNPQQYMNEVANIIERKMKQLLVDGIKYRKLGDDAYYTQELFENKELTGYLGKNMMKANLEKEKYPYEYIIYDSEPEEEFAKRFEKDPHVKVYAKLPDWFKIDTPLGSYNPDWAVLFEKDGEERVYFVVETKSSILDEDLRFRERSKIKCAKEHFRAIDTGARFTESDDYDKFIDDVYDVKAGYRY